MSSKLINRLRKYLLILVQLTHFISLTLPKYSLTKIIVDAFMERDNFLHLFGILFYKNPAEINSAESLKILTKFLGFNLDDFIFT